MKKYIIFILLVTWVLACKEEPIGQTAVNNIPPGIVTNVQVESIPGGAIITFDFPEDEDLLYVKAVYELAENPETETKTSLYNNSLTVEGFGNTDEREVALYSVDRSQNISEPVYVKINPLKPPIYTIFETLNMYEDFGGVVYTWKNETKTNLAISLLHYVDSISEYSTLETLYTSRISGSQAYRGLESKKMDFGLYIRDYWGNYSDTTFFTMTPLFEMQIPNDKIKHYNINNTDTEAAWVSSGWTYNNLWNDEISTAYGWHTETDAGPLPHQITFRCTDGKVKLSRVGMLHRTDRNFQYRHGDPSAFELWGSNEPNPDGSDDGWIFIGQFDCYKPSGLPGTNTTDEDMEYISEEESFSIDSSLPEFQYFRMKVTKTWSGTNLVHIARLPLYGIPEWYKSEDNN